MTALQSYLASKNALRSMFKMKPLLFPENSSEVRAIFQILEADTSPENLYCDGEASSQEVKEKIAFYSAVETELNELLTYI